LEEDRNKNNVSLTLPFWDYKINFFKK
jgi:hypothetical protein